MRFKLFALLLGLVGFVYAHNYSELKHLTFHTKHFVVHYPENLQSSALQLNTYADEIFEKVSNIYNYKSKRKTHIILRDDEDKSNGFAVYSLNSITLWVSPPLMRLRGHDQWLKSVLTHEFSHIVSLRASAPIGFLIEGIRLGAIANGNTNENTDFGGSLFIPSHHYSRWWAEGTAQVDTQSLQLDPWDSHRDMLLRSATLENNLLTFDQMRNITTRDRFGGEMVYNQGFNFITWYQKKFGHNTNALITRLSQKRWRFDFDHVIEDQTLTSKRDLDLEWKKELQDNYHKQTQSIRENIIEGHLIKTSKDEEVLKHNPQDRPYAHGFGVYKPQFSPSGQWYSFIDRSKLYIVATSFPFQLPLVNNESEVDLKLVFEASDYAWRDDSNQIVITRNLRSFNNGYAYNDLFLIDFTKISTIKRKFLNESYGLNKDRKEKLKNKFLHLAKQLHIKPKRLTHQERAFTPTWVNDQIYFSKNEAGTRSLAVFDLKSKSTRVILSPSYGEQIISPVKMGSEQKIFFTWVKDKHANLHAYDLNTKQHTNITNNMFVNKDPFYDSNMHGLFFSSDQNSGVFQIYFLDFSNNQLHQITNTPTGAFMPYVYENHLIYSKFSSFGFKAYELGLDFSQFIPSSLPLKAHNKNEEVDTKPMLTRPYSFSLRPARLFPSVLLENGQFKAGAALNIADQLEKHELDASVLLGKDQDYQVIYHNRMFYPTLFASYTSYVRSDDRLLVSDGDGLDDEPRTITSDNIQFIQAGLFKDFYIDGFFRSEHELRLYYNKRFVKRTLGVPTVLDNELVDEFELIDNDGVNVRWSMLSRPNENHPNDDINPTQMTQLTLDYAFTHTSLALNDTSIPSPNKNYFFHQGQVQFSKYSGILFKRPYLRDHRLWFKFTGAMKSRDVNSNDEFYLGGRLNFRAFGQITPNTLFYGYEDFSISGETLLLGSLGYTLPLAKNIDSKIGPMFFDSVYTSLFFEAGNVWTHGEFKNIYQNPSQNAGAGQVLLYDLGFELKCKAFIFNDFNAFHSLIRVAYGFQDKAKYGFSDEDNPLRIYMGIGTSF